ncbi:MAG: CopG family transcriptional regulator [Oscillospiraceae bacterium]|nr:CopG family transcriptional regulator [Oscillospiraceae bacterium]
MPKKLKITKRSNIKGDDGYKVFSIRIKEDVLNILDDISIKTNRSRNDIINMMIEFGIANCEIDENDTE